MTTTYSYPNSNWENKTLDYDLTEFAWPQWVIEVIQEIEPQVTDLTKIHETVPIDRIVHVLDHVQLAFGRREFAERFDLFAEKYIKPLIDNQPYLIRRQATMSLVLPNQEALARRLPFHQGIFYANGRGQRVIWMALTRCEGTNSMYIADTEPSRDLTKRVLAEQWDLGKFEEECLKIARPVNIVPGQAHLFHEEHIHGNVNNTTGYTRATIDWHVLLKGGEYHRRLPGSYFRLPGDYQAQQQHNYTGKTFVSYVGNNTEFSKHISFMYQRSSIDAYCQKHKIIYNSVQFENEYLDWLPVLEYYIKQQPNGIVLSSIYALPDEPQRRDFLMQLAVEHSVELHFANEQFILKNQQDFSRIKTYLEWGVKSDGPQIWQV